MSEPRAEIARQASTIAFGNGFHVIALIAFAAVPLVFAFGRRREPR